MVVGIIPACHLVSNVRGTAAEGISDAAIVAAVFPGGTITGC